MSELLEQLRTVPWYDRNPKTITRDFSGSPAPHAASDQQTYTVPNGKIFLLESCIVCLERETAATAEGWAGARVFAREAPIVYATIRSNTVGDKDKMNSGRSIIMKPGNEIKINSFDLSTDGTIRYDCAFHGIEFDAFPIEELPFRVKLPVKDIQEPDSVVKGQM